MAGRLQGTEFAMSQPQGEIIECPACGCRKIDESVCEFDGICSECGFVVHDSTNPTETEWVLADEKREENQQEDWLTVCRVRDATEKQLAQAFATIEDIAHHFDLPIDIREEAADVYCDAFHETTTDGRDTTCLVAVCVRLASLEVEKPVPTSRLTEIHDVDDKKFRQSYIALRKELEYTPPTLTPIDYLWFLSKALDLDESELQATERPLKAVSDERSLIGKDPTGIAAATIYLEGQDYTQSTVAEAAGVSTETIRVRANQLQKLLNHD